MAKKEAIKNTKQQIKKSIKTASISSIENNKSGNDSSQYKKPFFKKSYDSNSKFKNNGFQSKSNGYKKFGSKDAPQRDNFHDKRKSNFKNNNTKGFSKFSNDNQNFNKDSKFKGNSNFNKNTNNTDVKEKRRRELDSDTLELRRLYNKLMLKNDSKKEDIVKKIFSIIKENYKEFVFKHDGGRIIQGCIKYGNTEQRALLINQLKDLVADSAMKKYSIYLSIKIWKYADPIQREQILKLVLKKLTFLIKSPSGEMFLNYMISNCSSSQKEQLVDEYLKYVLKSTENEIKELKIRENITPKQRKESIDSNDSFEIINTKPKAKSKSKMEIDDEVKIKSNKQLEEDSNIVVKKTEGYGAQTFVESLKQKLELILEKECHRNYVFHHALNKIFDYLDIDTKTYISDIFNDDFESFLFYKDSMELACRMWTVCSTKNKKKIIKKLFKDNWCANLLSFEFNSIFIAKVLLFTDDTKLTNKFVLKPLLAYCYENDFKLFFAILDKVLFHEKLCDFGLIYNVDSSNKKSKLKIQHELINYCKEDILNMFKTNTEQFFTQKELLIFFIRFIESLVSNKLNINSETEQKLKNDQLISDLTKEILKTFFAHFKYDFINNQDKLIDNKDGHYGIIQLIKKMLTPNLETTEEIKQIINEFMLSFIDLLKENFNITVSHKSVFALLIIYESNSYRDKLFTFLKENMNKIEAEAIKSEKEKKKTAISILRDHIIKDSKDTKEHKEPQRKK